MVRECIPDLLGKLTVHEKVINIFSIVITERQPALMSNPMVLRYPVVGILDLTNFHAKSLILGKTFSCQI